MNAATRSRSRRRALLLALLLTLLPAVVWASVTLVNPTLPWRNAGGASAQLQGGAYTLNAAVGNTGSSTAAATGGAYSLVSLYVPPQQPAPVGLQPVLYLPLVRKPQ